MRWAYSSHRVWQISRSVSGLGTCKFLLLLLLLLLLPKCSWLTCIGPTSKVIHPKVWEAKLNSILNLQTILDPLLVPCWPYSRQSLMGRNGVRCWSHWWATSHHGWLCPFACTSHLLSLLCCFLACRCSSSFLISLTRNASLCRCACAIKFCRRGSMTFIAEEYSDRYFCRLRSAERTGRETSLSATGSGGALLGSGQGHNRTKVQKVQKVQSSQFGRSLLQVFC